MLRILRNYGNVTWRHVGRKTQMVYFGDKYPHKEKFYHETEEILKRHPRLKIALCHMYFLSADIDKAANILDTYPNTNFDLAPGVEYLYNMSRNRDEWHDFFIKYQDRIFFGTDIMELYHVKASMNRVWLVRNFLESDEEFYTPKALKAF